MQSFKTRIAGQWKQWLIPIGLCLLAAMGIAASSDPSGVLRSRVYKLKHITSQQAQELFSQLGIGKSYNTLTGDVLIVTSDVGSDLLKATEIIPLLDQDPPARIRVLMVGTAAEPLPSPEALTARLAKTMTVGTMTDAPVSGSAKPAIVDVVDTKLIAIGAEDVLNEIETVAAEWKKENQKTALPTENAAPAEVIVEPNVPAEPNLPKPPGPEELVPQQEPNVPAEPNLPTEPRPEGPLTPPDANAPSDRLPVPQVPAEQPAQPETEEDFLSEGLMKALADAEEKTPPSPIETPKTPAQAVPVQAVPAEPVQTPAAEPTESLPAPILPVPQPGGETAAEPNEAAPAQPAPDESDEMKALQEFIEKVQREEAAMAQEQAQTEAKAAEQGDERPAQETDRVNALQAELAQLRQKLTELETQAAAPRPQAGAAGSPEAAAPTAAPAAKPQEKVQSPEAAQIPASVAEKELETVVDLPQEVELESLVDLVGKQLGLNYMYDPAIIRGQKVQLKIHGGKIKVKDTYALLESALRFKGYIMTRRDQLVTILQAGELATRAEPTLRGPDEPIQPGDIVVASMFALNYIDATSAQNMLKTMNLGASFTPLPETNTLIVTDYAYRMDRIRKVLEMIDVSSATREYKFRTLKYMKPSDIVTKLKDLVGQLQGVSLQISTSAAAGAQTQMRTVTTRNPQTGQVETKQVPISAPATAAAPGEAAPAPTADTVFIDTDDRTNRILIIGKADQITLIEELVDVLDVPQYNLKYVREYIIQNVEAVEVVNVLNELGLASVTVSMPAPTAATGRTAASGRTAQTQTQPQTPEMAMSPRTGAAGAAGTAGGDQPYVAVRPATNSLLVNGTAEQHSAIELVIAHVDVVQKDQRTIRQYEIQYVDTQEIINTMTDLGMIAPQTTTGTTGMDGRGTRGTTSARSTAVAQAMPVAEGVAPPMVLPTAEGGSGVELTAEYPQIAVLETTNSLLVYATPRQHDAIALVIAHADRQLDVTTTPYVVYALENQDPVELAEVLTKLIQETVEDAAASKTSTPESKIQVLVAPTGGGTAAGTPPTLEEQKIKIIPDEMSYSLIVYANKRNQQWVGELIKSLDEYRPQVLLDCTLVVINQDETFKYDMDIVSKTYSGLTLRENSPIETISGDFSEPVYGEARSTSGNFTGFLNSDMVQALLEMVQTKNYGRVMARPKILVNDNQEGEIKTENTTSIAQQKSIIQPSSDQGQTITTTDVSFAEYSEGVTLKIKPHISKGDMLRLEITLGRSDFKLQQDVKVAGETYPRPPDILSTDVTTVATVPDGTTIILGGLEGVDQQKNTTKVPILGDIPIVGGLFRGVDDIGAQSKLYVFVKAHVLRPSDQIEGLEDIRRVSEKNRRAFEEMEKKFQEHQDWPGIKPKPMDPVKVLEEDEAGLTPVEEK